MNYKLFSLKKIVKKATVLGVVFGLCTSGYTMEPEQRNPVQRNIVGDLIDHLDNGIRARAVTATKDDPCIIVWRNLRSNVKDLNSMIDVYLRNRTREQHKTIEWSIGCALCSDAWNVRLYPFMKYDTLGIALNNCIQDKIILNHAQVQRNFENQYPNFYWEYYDESKRWTALPSGNSSIPHSW